MTKKMTDCYETLELLKGAKCLQSNSDFMNKIKERSNIAIFKPNATIRLGQLFITNCSRQNHENKELQIILTMLDFSTGINKTSSISSQGFHYCQEIQLQVIFFYYKTPSHGNETYINKRKYAQNSAIFFMERVGGLYQIFP